MAITARRVKHAAYTFLTDYSTDHLKHIYINCLEEKGQWERKMSHAGYDNQGWKMVGVGHDG